MLAVGAHQIERVRRRARRPTRPAAARAARRRRRTSPRAAPRGPARVSASAPAPRRLRGVRPGRRIASTRTPAAFARALERGGDRRVEARFAQPGAAPRARAVRRAAAGRRGTRCRASGRRAAGRAARTGRRSRGCGPRCRHGALSASGTTTPSRSSRRATTSCSSGVEAGQLGRGERARRTATVFIASAAPAGSVDACGRAGQHDVLARRSVDAHAQRRAQPQRRCRPASASAAASWASGAIGSGRVCCRSRSRDAARRPRPADRRRAARAARRRVASSVRREHGRVGEVDAHRQRRAQLGVVAAPARAACRTSVVAGHRMDADGQVDRRLAERVGGVDRAARQVQRVAGLEHGVDAAAGLGRARATSASRCCSHGWSCSGSSTTGSCIASACARPPAARTRRARRSAARTRWFCGGVM